jgi:hypothetical protein
MQPIGSRKEMYMLESWRYGWQRFGEYLGDTFLDPFAEGAWMTKHGDKYYFQYGAPGTEFSGYADGVVVGDSPLGPFTPQSLPMSWKPGGFTRGAGHGATFQDNAKNYWHVSTIALSVKNNFERRIGIWPAGFDKDGVMYCNTAFGDYPHYVKSQNLTLAGGETFTGWMLLNNNKPVQVSSTLGSYYPNYAVDESIKTYWMLLLLIKENGYKQILADSLRSMPYRSTMPTRTRSSWEKRKMYFTSIEYIIR